MNATTATPTAARSAHIPWGRLVLWFFLSRLVMFGIAGLSLRLLTRGPFFAASRNPIDWFMQWDARWYLAIAQSGYTYDPTQMSSVNFLPVYPMLVRFFGGLIHNVDVAGYLVSNAFCLGAAALLWRLVRDLDAREETADGAALFFLLGPVALFFSTTYSESTFIFFAVATLLAARRRTWWLAGVCGAIAALSRSVGVLLIAPLVIEYVQANWSREAWRRLGTWGRLLWCGVPALGTLGYVAWLAWRFGDPMAYVVSQRHGGHSSGHVWTLFSTDEFHSLPEFYKYWFGAAAITAVVLLIVGALLRIPLSFTAFAAVLTWLYLSTRSLEGLPRFFSVVVPFYATLGLLRTKWPSLGTILLAVSASLMTFSVVLFVNGYWFT